MINYNLPQLLKTLVDEKGSDLHITKDSPPRVRVDGKLIPLQVPPLSDEDAKELCFSVLTPEQQSFFMAKKEMDLAFSVTDLARFRANIFFQKTGISGVFRVIPQDLKTIDDLGLSKLFKDLCDLPKGLVLLTGPTGSGKSTTLAAMINHINENRSDHIVTIEDPIEFVHEHKRCVINQREIGEDTVSFSAALKSVLRQDPDVVLIGELRDLETVSAAVTTSETGHLVFSTLHTNGCVQTLNRIIDVFPTHQQDQIKTQLAMNLSAVISQTLVPQTNGGRCLAVEILLVTPAIRSLIAEGKFNQIYSYIQSGQGGSGMITMNQSLFSLVESRKISQHNALIKSPDPEELEVMLKKGSRIIKKTA